MPADETGGHFMRCTSIVLISLLFLLSLGCGTSRYNQAEKFMKQEQYEKAIRTYLKQLDPHIRDNSRYIYYDREAITGIGEAYWHMNKYDYARKILKKVTDKDPFYGKAQFYLGLCHESLLDEDSAIATYRKFSRISDSDPFKQLMIGRLDWLIRKRVTMEVRELLEKESQMQLADHPEKSVGVLYFISQSDDPQWRPLQKGIAEMINTDLAVVDELVVVERLHLNMLLQEIELGITGAARNENAEKMGKLLGAQTLVKGSYLITPDYKMTMDAGIYEADRPEYPLPASYEGTLSTLFQMEKELVMQILDYFGIELTIEEREQILKIH